MIRWGYVVPRLALLATLILTLWLGSGTVLKWSLARSVQSATGTRVSIGRAGVSWLGTKLNVDKVEVANPKSPHRNLFQADSISFDLDANALSCRKFVVNQGAVYGLHVGTNGNAAHALESTEDTEPSSTIGSTMAKMGEKWLDNAVAVLQQDLEENLQSVKLARELMQRWPARYDDLETGAKALTERVDQIRQMVETIQREPLRAVELTPQVVSDLDGLQRQLLALRSNVDQLHQQALRDKEAIVRAKQRDVDLVRESVRLENLDAQALSEYLLGRQLGAHMATLIDWIRWGRRILPSQPSSITATRGRGTDVVFPGSRRLPEMLIRSLDMDGEATVGGNVVGFEATVTGLTNQPKVYGRPTQLQVRSSGPLGLLVRAELDRTGREPRDRILIDVPRLPRPTTTLGDARRLAVTVLPGNAHLWGRLVVHGDSLSGEIILKQEPVELKAVHVDSLAGKLLTTTVESAAAQMNSLEASIVLSGSLERPKWELRSNLGSRLAAAINESVTGQVASLREDLVLRIEEQVAKRSWELEELLAEKRATVLQKLKVGDEAIQGVMQKMAGPLGATGQLFDENSPLRSIFSR